VVVKIRGGEAVVAPPVKPFASPPLCHRDAFRGRFAEPAVHQPSFALLFIAPAPTAKCSLIDPQQLSRLQFAQSARLASAENIPEFPHSHTAKNLCPLHRTLPWGKDHHEPDRSCAT